MNKKALEIYRAEVNAELSLPIADGGIKAGFPSPAQDFMDLAIDLNKELVSHPASTFYGRVRGESMQGTLVNDGDASIIDKSLEPQNGDMAVCFVDGVASISRRNLHIISEYGRGIKRYNPDDKSPNPSLVGVQVSI